MDGKLETILQDLNSEPQDLSLEYLRKITEDFTNKRLLGEGGFGKVYKRVLQNGKIVAVKKLYQLNPGPQEKQFENEVYHLMRLKHPNIVRFIGYCYETRNECVEVDGNYLFAEKQQQRLLCLEYLSNGSLDGHLSDESSGLDWGTRYKIIKGICCGIYYLHEECKCKTNASIIHLDLKPANILLDDNMVPKIADFGLSRLFHGTKTQTCTTNLAGTFGYMAPEYIYRRVITTKADIYSLGVLIIEIIMGDRVDPFSLNTSSEDFIEHVLRKWRSRLQEAPSEIDCNQIKWCLQMGIKCIRVDLNERPTAKEIVDGLNEWESKNLKNKLVEENTNCYSDSNNDDVPLPPAFDQMLLHRNDGSCPAKGRVHGVCYGVVGNNLPARVDVVQLYKSNNIQAMRIYFPDQDALAALRGSAIAVILDVGGVDAVRVLASRASAAAEWVQDNVQPYQRDVLIRYIAVGNNVPPGDAAGLLLPAMRNVRDALVGAGLDGSVKVSTAVKMDVFDFDNTFPPSSGVFKDPSVMSPVAQFLAATGAPLLVNVFPYFAYKDNPGNINFEFANFRPGAPAVTDSGNGLVYTNLFDAMVDAIYAALDKAGAPNVRVVVSESGWPSDGGFAASVDNAWTYNQAVIDHARQGTPRKPGVLETYVFAMFNENRKPGDEIERHFGLFNPDKTPVYPITFPN